MTVESWDLEGQKSMNTLGLPKVMLIGLTH